MLFGFLNALVIFQKFINKILMEKLNIIVIINLKNILIFIRYLGQPYIEAVH